MNAYVANDEDWSISWLPVMADCTAHDYGNHIRVPVVFFSIYSKHNISVRQGKATQGKHKVSTTSSTTVEKLVMFHIIFRMLLNNCK